MSAANPSLFFPATQSVNQRLGDTFGFVWASYAGLRELWWQVRGFRSQFPQLHIDQVTSKFLSGLSLPGGIDLKRVCVDTSWESHEEEFGKWILFEACTLYENWVEKICGELFSASAAEQHVKNLQFPTGTNKKGRRTGFRLAIDAANVSQSALIRTEFFPKLSTSKLNRWTSIEDHLVAYRYFKECRNSIIHSDGIANQDLIDLHARLVACQANSPAPFRNTFALPAPILGAAIPLHLKDCVLFATVVRLLICTFDAALCVSSASESALERRLRAARSGSAKFTNFPGDPVKRTQRVKRLLATARVPLPQNVANVEAWMLARSII
jgi:hypothetical protein